MESKGDGYFDEEGVFLGEVPEFDDDGDSITFGSGEYGGEVSTDSDACYSEHSEEDDGDGDDSDDDAVFINGFSAKNTVVGREVRLKPACPVAKHFPPGTLEDEIPRMVDGNGDPKILWHPSTPPTDATPPVHLGPIIDIIESIRFASNELQYIKRDSDELRNKAHISKLDSDSHHVVVFIGNMPYACLRFQIHDSRIAMVDGVFTYNRLKDAMKKPVIGTLLRVGQGAIKSSSSAMKEIRAQVPESIKDGFAALWGLKQVKGPKEPEKDHVWMRRVFS